MPAQTDNGSQRKAEDTAYRGQADTARSGRSQKRGYGGGPGGFKPGAAAILALSYAGEW